MLQHSVHLPALQSTLTQSLIKEDNELGKNRCFFEKNGSCYPLSTTSDYSSLIQLDIIPTLESVHSKSTDTLDKGLTDYRFKGQLEQDLLSSTV